MRHLGVKLPSRSRQRAVWLLTVKMTVTLPSSLPSCYRHSPGPCSVVCPETSGFGYRHGYRHLPSTRESAIGYRHTVTWSKHVTV